jgi:hypothetical protein
VVASVLPYFEKEKAMKANFAARCFLRRIMSMSLLGVAGLAILAVGPGLVPTFHVDGAETLAFSRPVAPTIVVATQPVGNPTEAMVLANWEFTGNKNDFGDAIQDVKQALQLANQADQQAANALLENNKKQAQQEINSALKEVLSAYNRLADAAGDARSPALLADANAMFFVYTKMYNDVQANNFSAVFQDTQNAQTIGNKAIVDASPFK